MSCQNFFLRNCLVNFNQIWDISPEQFGKFQSNLVYRNLGYRKWFNLYTTIFSGEIIAKQNKPMPIRNLLNQSNFAKISLFWYEDNEYLVVITVSWKIDWRLFGWSKYQTEKDGKCINARNMCQLNKHQILNRIFHFVMFSTWVHSSALWYM